MTADLTLIWNVLRQIDAAPEGRAMQQLDFGDKDEALMAHHLRQMIEEDLIVGAAVGNNPRSFIIKKLTWKGHDFLLRVNSATVRRKVLAALESGGSAATVRALAFLVEQVAKNIGH